MKTSESINHTNSQNTSKLKNSTIKPIKVQISESTLDDFLKRNTPLAQNPKSNQRRGNQFTLQKTTRSSNIKPFNELKYESPVHKQTASKFSVKEPIMTPNMKTMANNNVVKNPVTPTHNSAVDSSKKRKISLNSIVNLAQKYKPTSSCLFTPVRKATRNKSISGIKHSTQNSSRKVLKFELSHSPQTVHKVSELSSKPVTQQAKLKSVITNEQALHRKKLNKPKSYIEKVKAQNIPKPNPEKSSQNRIEMIHKKNLRRQTMLAQAKTFKPEVVMIDSVLCQNKNSVPYSVKMQKPVIINNYLSTKQNIRSECLKEDLKSIRELTGEDTASIRSSLKNSDTSTVLGWRNKDSLKWLDTEITPKEISNIITPQRKDTIDDLRDFVKNIQACENHRDIEVKDDRTSRHNEDDVLDIEYYGLNKTNNSIGSIAHTLKLNKSNNCTWDLPSKRSNPESKNIFDKQKSSYSSAFLELLNSEIIEDSPKNNNIEKEKELSDLNFEILNQSDNNSCDLSWNVISDNHKYQNNNNNISNEKLLSNINDFLKANWGKRKRSLQEIENSKLIHQMNDQGQQVSKRPEDNFWKYDDNKASNSDIFDLSHSKGSRFKDCTSKRNRDDNSDIFKSEISTLKDFSNLCSSKTGSIVLSNRIVGLCKNSVRINV